MSFFRALLCIFFPPLAVVDKGCGSVLVITMLTIAGWIPGVLGALIISGTSDYGGIEDETGGIVGGSIMADHIE